MGTWDSTIPHRWGTWCSRRFYWKALDTTRTFTRTWNGLVSRRCFFAFASVCVLCERGEEDRRTLGNWLKKSFKNRSTFTAE
jgi:hypothetical protein